MADLVWSDPDPDKEEFAISPRGAGYTFGAQVVRKFLHTNGMDHILRAHQLCMEGYQVLYGDLNSPRIVDTNSPPLRSLDSADLFSTSGGGIAQNGVAHVLATTDATTSSTNNTMFHRSTTGMLSTVWSAPNYCYRCGNLASILEVGVNGERNFNVFEAAPENERDGPGQQQQQQQQMGINGQKPDTIHYFL